MSLVNCFYFFLINSIFILFFRFFVGCVVVFFLCFGGSLGFCWVGVFFSYVGGWKNVFIVLVFWLSLVVRSDFFVCGVRIEVYRVGSGIFSCFVFFYYLVLLSFFFTLRFA